MPLDIDRAIHEAKSDEIRVCLQQSKKLLSHSMIMPNSVLRNALENREFDRIKDMIDSLKAGKNIEPLTGLDAVFFNNMLTAFPVFGPRKTPVVNKVRRWGIMTTLLCVIGALVLAVFFSKLSVKMAGAVSKSWAGIVDTHAEYVQKISLPSGVFSFWNPPMCALESKIIAEMKALKSLYATYEQMRVDKFNETIKETREILREEMDGTQQEFWRKANASLDAFNQSSRKALEEFNATAIAVLDQLRNRLNETMQALKNLETANEIQLADTTKLVMETYTALNTTGFQAKVLETMLSEMQIAMINETKKLIAIRYALNKTDERLVKTSELVEDVAKKVEVLFYRVCSLVDENGRLTYVSWAFICTYAVAFLYFVVDQIRFALGRHAQNPIHLDALTLQSLVSFMRELIALGTFCCIVYGFVIFKGYADNFFRKIDAVGDAVTNMPGMVANTTRAMGGWMGRPW